MSSLAADAAGLTAMRSALTCVAGQIVHDGLS
jgi:hypothetical protein